MKVSRSRRVNRESIENEKNKGEKSYLQTKLESSENEKKPLMAEN